jgi:hypothetical protein
VWSKEQEQKPALLARCEWLSIFHFPPMIYCAVSVHLTSLSTDGGFLSGQVKEAISLIMFFNLTSTNEHIIISWVNGLPTDL